MKKKLAQMSKNQVFWPAVIFLIIILFNGIITKGDFFSITIVDGHFYGRIIDIFRNGGKLMILAAGMTMVLATGGTDISVGSVMAISGAIACSIINGNLLPGLNGNVALAIIFAICSGIICGCWNGFLVSKIKIQPIVATMILLVAGRGIAQLITNGKIITITSDAYYFINGGYILGLPVPLYIVIFLVGLLILFVTKTAFGLFMEAIGCNPLASKFAGIQVDLYLLGIYTISGAFAAVAGLIESANANQYLNQTVNQISTGIDVSMRDIFKSVNLMAEVIADSDSDYALKEMYRLTKTHEEIAGVLYAGSDESYITAGMTRISRDSFLQEDWYRTAVGSPNNIHILSTITGRNIVTDAVYATGDVFSIATAVKDPKTGVVEGVLLLDIRHSIISDAIWDSWISSDGFVFVLDEQNNIVYSPINNVVYRIKPVVELSNLMKQTEQGDFDVKFTGDGNDEIHTLGLTFNHMLEHIQKLMDTIYEEEEEKRYAQLKILQEQFKPHFLYNTLDTINWMARENGATEVVKLVDALTNMFRISLNNGNDYIPISDEIRYVSSYLYIQKIRYGTRMDYSIELDEGCSTVIIPKLILQPLVENAIYHGVKQKRSVGHLSVKVTRSDNSVLLSVADDGAGMNSTQLEKLQKMMMSSEKKENDSFGMYYVRERLRLLYQDNYLVSIESQEEIGTTITIKIPSEL